MLGAGTTALWAGGWLCTLFKPGEIWSWVHGFEFPCWPKEVRYSLKLYPPASNWSLGERVLWRKVIKQCDCSLFNSFTSLLTKFSHTQIIIYCCFSWVITVMADKIPVTDLDSMSSVKPDINFMSVPRLCCPYCFLESCSWQAEWKTSGCTNLKKKKKGRRKKKPQQQKTTVFPSASIKKGSGIPVCQWKGFGYGAVCEVDES